MDENGFWRHPLLLHTPPHWKCSCANGNISNVDYYVWSLRYSYTVEYFSPDLQTGWTVAAHRVLTQTITVSYDFLPPTPPSSSTAAYSRVLLNKQCNCGCEEGSALFRAPSSSALVKFHALDEYL